ncbi:MAG: hypothetical protein EXQ53_01620 [Acidobacteria bacterium]|nr:hypothetical protein [Acidobacteriota bacterium]
MLKHPTKRGIVVVAGHSTASTACAGSSVAPSPIC